MAVGALHRVGLAAAVSLHAVAPAWAECRSDTLDVRGAWGQAAFTVDVADTPELRGLGLMNRPSMPATVGMLFVYDAPQSVAFWMKNTLIPLDMVFVGPEGKVLRIHENAQPLDLTTIPGGDGVQYVLEINGGLARVFGIGPGDEMRHPSIDQENAVWPCE